MDGARLKAGEHLSEDLSEELWPKEGSIVGAEFISVGHEIRKRGVWRTVSRIQGPDKRDVIYFECSDGSAWLTASKAGTKMRPPKKKSTDDR